MNESRRHSSGFSLVEMVVVIGVISVLLGILLPTLGSFRAEAKSNVCASNLRQLIAAVEGYRQQNDSMLPACEALPLETPTGPIGGLPNAIKGFIPLDSPVHLCPCDYHFEMHNLGTSYTYLPGAGMLLMPINPAISFAQNKFAAARVVTQNYEGQFAQVFPVLYDSEDRHTNTPQTPRNAVFIDGSVRRWGESGAE